ncbi:MAG TPA: hypothetical protein VNI55_06590, partial [Gaiellaceae bacterium]|nr:hypothetical protein [Gaiellaceae bacterium]
YEQSLGRAQAGYETTSGRLQGDYQDSLGRLATGFQQGGYDARGQAQQLFSGIERELAAALLGADAEDARAQEDASQRALMEALRYGFDPGAGGFAGGGGGPGGGTPNQEPIAPGARRQFDPAGDSIDLTRLGEIAAGSQPNAIVQTLLADPRRQRRIEELLGL